MKCVFLTSLKTRLLLLGLSNAPFGVMAALAGDVPADLRERGSVTGLDREDREGRLDVGDVLEPRSLAGVGGDALVLEYEGGLQEIAAVVVGAAEVELRALDRVAPERTLEELDVRPLVGCDELGERELIAGHAGLGHGLLVERRLQVLEGEGEVQDRPVVGGCARRGKRRQRAEGGAAGDDRTAEYTGLAQECRAGIGVYSLRRLADRAVDVELLEGEAFVGMRQGALLGWSAESLDVLSVLKCARGYSADHPRGRPATSWRVDLHPSG